MKRKWTLSDILLRLTVLLIIIFILAPLLVIIGASFTETGHLIFPPRGFTLDWYRNYFNDYGWMEATRISLYMAFVSMLCSMVIGTITAYSIDRSRRRNFWMSFFVMPITIPTVVTGLAMLRFYVALDVERGFLVLLSGHVVFITPFVIRTMCASFYRFNVSIEEASLTLGANKIKTFLLVTLPSVKSGLIASSFFAFIVSFGNLAISIFLTTARFTTLPIKIYTQTRYSSDPTLAAVSTFVVLMSVIIMFIIERKSNAENLF